MKRRDLDQPGLLRLEGREMTRHSPITGSCSTITSKTSPARRQPGKLADRSRGMGLFERWAEFKASSRHAGLGGARSVPVRRQAATTALTHNEKTPINVVPVLVMDVYGTYFMDYGRRGPRTYAFMKNINWASAPRGSKGSTGTGTERSRQLNYRRLTRSYKKPARKSGLF
jgi:hypothetical protein